MNNHGWHWALGIGHWALLVLIPLNPAISLTVVINEFVADNVSVIADQDGEYDDWLELFNNSDQPLNLNGYFLSDDISNPTRWTFPDTTISPFGFLLIWTDDDEEQSGLHTNFKLSAEGEEIVLATPEGAIVNETVYGAVGSDISIGRFPNGTGNFREMNPTPGGINTPEYPSAGIDSSDIIFNENTIYSYNINFYYDNWEDSLIYYFEFNDEAYIPAELVFNDTLVIDSIGVRYKGNSSYTLSASTPKKPLKFKFDEYREQSFFGVKRLNFSNCIKDPSFLREKIAYGIARRYMPAPRTAYANLYFEGELLGLYIQVEQVDKSFLSRYYDDDNGNLFKAGVLGATLEYEGPEQANYTNDYELKTNEFLNDWSRLIEFLDRLNNTPAPDLVSVISNYVNLDNVLRLLAFNMVLSNFDSYTGSSRNYYLYQNPLNNKFDIIPWDLNESFGVYNNNWNVYTVDIISPSNITQRPLMNRIMENDSLRQAYMNYVAEMKDGSASTDSVHSIATMTVPVIDAYVQADEHKFYSYQNFLDNIEEEVMVSLGVFIPGLKSFSQLRNTNLTLQLQTVWVYPGDTNNDGEVNAQDILPIGVFFLEQGNARVSASFAWRAQDVIEWDVPSATYADANGDGTVDENDVIGIGVNWGNIHNSGTLSVGAGFGELYDWELYRNNYSHLYNSLSGSGEAVIAIKNLLDSIFNFNGITPQAFSLQQNYPNPFNSSTTITFNLPEPCEVALAIYNIQGQEVWSMVNGQWSTGEHRLKWDTEGLASGIYIYHLRTEKWEARRKMVLMK